MTRIVTILCLLNLCIVSVLAQTPKNAAEKIKQNSAYEWGEGSGETEREARNNALSALSQKFGATVAGRDNQELTDRGDGNEQKNDTYKTSVAYAARFTNLNTLDWEEEVGGKGKPASIRYHALCYVKKSDLAKENEERRQKITAMIYDGIEQEKRQAIAAALRYYSWAYTMIENYRERIQIDVDGVTKDARVWLPGKIESVLNNIELSFVESEILFTPDEYDKHTVNMAVTYANKPVQSLDLTYFNGERKLQTTAKNGTARMKFVDLSEIKELQIEVEYEYLQEAEQSYDPDIQATCQLGSAFTNKERAKHKIPVSVGKNTISVRKKEAQKLEETRSAGISAAAENELPMVGVERKTIDRPICDDQDAIEKMIKVEQALRTRAYSSVRSLFTDEGYELFRRITDKGKITVARKNPEFRVESTALFTYGTGIPVALQNDRRITNEKIVFRFDKATGLIKSVAYALTDKAESDIFRQAQWDINSRYSILTFMEDYQTAFRCQNIGFIEKLFSDQAIIIVGNKEPTTARKTGMFDGQDLSKKYALQNFRYKRYNKDEYIASLKRLFNNTSWTYVDYEENQIAKVNTSGLVDNEILWIEIRQNWKSAGGYNDTGYLALQINMKPAGSQINVRTFTPEFISLDSLKTSFPVSITLNEK